MPQHPTAPITGNKFFFQGLAETSQGWPWRYVVAYRGGRAAGYRVADSRRNIVGYAHGILDFYAQRNPGCFAVVEENVDGVWQPRLHLEHTARGVVEREPSPAEGPGASEVS